MRAYKVVAPSEFTFVGTQADATKKRMEMMERLRLRRVDIEIEETEIPTDKSGLIGFVNDLAEEVRNIGAE